MSNNRAEDLERLRSEIREVDRQIAELVARRQSLARDVGQQKQNLGRPVRDFGVEKAVLARMRQRAEQLGIEPNVLHAVASALIRGAVAVQELDLQPEPVRGDSLCTIIGGAGKMGAWFQRYVTSLGYATRIVEKDDPLDESLCQSDLVVLAVPLATMRAVLEQVLALSPPGLVLEIASLKSHLVDLVTAGAADGQQIVSLHPMFGPDKDLLAGQNIIVCRAGNQAAEDAVLALFQNTAAQLTELPLAEHDRYMTWVLNLPHLVNLAMGETLRTSGLDYQRLSSLGGTTFGAQMRVTAEVMSENPELYYHIQNINQHRDELYEAFGASVQRLAELSGAPGHDGFAAMMEEWLDYAGSEGHHE